MLDLYNYWDLGLLVSRIQVIILSCVVHLNTFIIGHNLQELGGA